ncbi:hypothetical protein Purlil1_13144 [Purpureocillium lilacinum]|uniref:Uncharacterized protein n=1 Tax=Purpureocillium lilacinum TaxID=33203 RepID=A0ABR0BEW9_PURLI|nr:hypothetical protein Purlil1_13144 [Purpureocillium lilacinum]
MHVSKANTKWQQPLGVCKIPQEFGAGITSMTWMPGGRICLGHANGDIFITNPRSPSGSNVYPTSTGNGGITALAALRGGGLAVGYYDGLVRIFRTLPDFARERIISAAKQPSPVLNLAWHAAESKGRHCSDRQIPCERCLKAMEKGTLRSHRNFLAIQRYGECVHVWANLNRTDDRGPKCIRTLGKGTAATGLCWVDWTLRGELVVVSNLWVVLTQRHSPRLIQVRTLEYWYIKKGTERLQSAFLPKVVGAALSPIGSPAGTLFVVDSDGEVRREKLVVPNKRQAPSSRQT